MCFFFLWSHVTNKAGTCDCLVSWHLVFVDEECCVCAFDVITNTLGADIGDVTDDIVEVFLAIDR